MCLAFATIPFSVRFIIFVSRNILMRHASSRAPLINPD